jgi:hypothetical protein
MRHHVSIVFENIPGETLIWEKLFCCDKYSNYCQRNDGEPLLQLQQYVFFIIITVLRNLAFKVGELKCFMLYAYIWVIPRRL